MITWTNFVSQLFNGLALGALLALISSGLTIIYGTLGVLNLAHGAMINAMISAKNSRRYTSETNWFTCACWSALNCALSCSLAPGYGASNGESAARPCSAL